MLAQIAQVTVQLLHSLFMCLDAFTLETIIELLEALKISYGVRDATSVLSDGDNAYPFLPHLLMPSLSFSLFYELCPFYVVDLLLAFLILISIFQARFLVLIGGVSPLGMQVLFLLLLVLIDLRIFHTFQFEFAGAARGCGKGIFVHLYHTRCGFARTVDGGAHLDDAHGPC